MMMSKTTDESKFDQLDASVSSLLERGRPGSSGDEEVDALARLAVGLRGLPSTAFRARLRAELLAGRSETSKGAWSRTIGSMFWSRRPEKRGIRMFGRLLHPRGFALLATAGILAAGAATVAASGGVSEAAWNANDVLATVRLPHRADGSHQSPTRGSEQQHSGDDGDHAPVPHAPNH